MIFMGLLFCNGANNVARTLECVGKIHDQMQYICIPWLVMKIPTLNSAAIFESFESIWASFCCSRTWVINQRNMQRCCERENESIITLTQISAKKSSILLAPFYRVSVSGSLIFICDNAHKSLCICDI
jgi:hypothetical protein